MVNAQEYLDQNYPQETRPNITDLSISYQELEGELDLSDFVNLEHLDCCSNQLTSLNVSNCRKLEYLCCHSKVVVIVPLSSKVHNLKFSFQAPTYFQGKPGKAKCEQVRAVDVERLLGEKQGSLTEAEMENIDKKLMVVLDLVKHFGHPSESKRKSF